VEESFSIHWKFEVCGKKKVSELLKVWSFKCAKEFFALLQVSSKISSLCNKRFASDRSFFFSTLREGSKIFFESFQYSVRMFVVAFVFKMESLKAMEKFDGVHLCKFKMHMMLSKHGLRKFVDGSATCQVKKLQGSITLG